MNSGQQRWIWQTRDEHLDWQPRNGAKVLAVAFIVLGLWALVQVLKNQEENGVYAVAEVVLQAAPALALGVLSYGLLSVESDRTRARFFLRDGQVHFGEKGSIQFLLVNTTQQPSGIYAVDIIVKAPANSPLHRSVFEAGDLRIVEDDTAFTEVRGGQALTLSADIPLPSVPEGTRATIRVYPVLGPSVACKAKDTRTLLAAAFEASSKSSRPRVDETEDEAARREGRKAQIDEAT